jgi:hypothetical protein
MPMDWATGATEFADEIILEGAVEDLIAKALSAVAEPAINLETLSDGHASRSYDTPGGLDEKEGILWRSGLQDDRFLNNLGLCRHCEDIRFSGERSHSHQGHYHLLNLKRMSLLGCRLCKLLFKSISNMLREINNVYFTADLVNIDPNTLVYSIGGLKLHFKIFTREGS